MRVDSLVDGKEVVLDRKRHVLTPRIVAPGADYADPMYPTVWIAEDRPREIVLPSYQGEPPELIMERSKKLVARAKGLGEPTPLSVGDLSIEKKQRNSPEQVRQRLRNMEDPRASVGDISVATDRKESLDAKVDAAMAGKDKGLSVGDLYRGLRSNDFGGPSTSESQEALMQMQARQRKKAEEVFEIKQIIDQQAQAKDVKREAVLEYLKTQLRVKR
jgi:hypothetical protein